MSPSQHAVSILDAHRQAQAGLDNIYLPMQAIIRGIVRENDLVNTYHLSLVDELANHRFSFQPGQFMMVSMPHLGEAPISFSSSPEAEDGFSLTIRNSGSLTGAIHQLRTGDIIGVRGPYGHPFPMERLLQAGLIFIAGGIGLAPLRPVIELGLTPERSSPLTLLYGSRTAEYFCFASDFQRWQSRGLDLHLTVDQATDDWNGPVGLVTELLDQVEVQPDAMALICGPDIMIQAVIKALQARGLPDERIITTLERRMKCGVGICGHCYLEDKLVCLDGPVFSAAQLASLQTP